HVPFVAEAGYVTGLLEADSGDPRAAAATLADAAAAAATCHHDRLATEALLELARIQADKLGQLERATAFAQSASWALARFGTEPGLDAGAAELQALILEGQGKHAEAAPYFERTLAIRERVSGPTSRAVTHALVALGENRRLQLRIDEAMDYYRR